MDDNSERTLLTINSDGSLSAVGERQSKPNAFFRLVNADGTNSFLSKNHKQQYIKSPNGCQNFILRQENGGYSNQFELVSACGNEEEERIELSDGKFHTFRLVDALIIHWIREASLWNLIREERKVNKTNGIFGCSKINTFSGFNQFLVNYSFLKLYAYHLSINNQ